MSLNRAVWTVGGGWDRNCNGTRESGFCMSGLSWAWRLTMIPSLLTCAGWAVQTINTECMGLWAQENAAEIFLASSGRVASSLVNVCFCGDAFAGWPAETINTECMCVWAWGNAAEICLASSSVANSLVNVRFSGDAGSEE